MSAHPSSVVIQIVPFIVSIIPCTTLFGSPSAVVRSLNCFLFLLCRFPISNPLFSVPIHILCFESSNTVRTGMSVTFSILLLSFNNSSGLKTYSPVFEHSHTIPLLSSYRKRGAIPLITTCSTTAPLSYLSIFRSFVIPQIHILPLLSRYIQSTLPSEYHLPSIRTPCCLDPNHSLSSVSL